MERQLVPADEKMWAMSFAAWVAIDRRSPELLSAALALGVDPNCPYLIGDFPGWDSPLAHVLQKQWGEGLTIVLRAIAARSSE